MSHINKSLIRYTSYIAIMSIKVTTHGQVTYAYDVKQIRTWRTTCTHNYLNNYVYTHNYLHTHNYLYTYDYLENYVYTHNYLYTYNYLDKYVYIHNYLYNHNYLDNYVHTHNYLYTKQNRLFLTQRHYRHMFINKIKG